MKVHKVDSWMITGDSSVRLYKYRIILDPKEYTPEKTRTYTRSDISWWVQTTNFPCLAYGGDYYILNDQDLSLFLLKWS
jgi:hypothetical protein